MDLNDFVQDTGRQRMGIVADIEALVNDERFANKFFGSEHVILDKTYELRRHDDIPSFQWPVYKAENLGPPSSDFTTILFGELDENRGTRIGAKGDWTSRAKFFEGVITNQTSCRNLYALRQPTGAGDILSSIYWGQVSEFVCMGDVVRDMTMAFDVQTPATNAPNPYKPVSGIQVLGTPIYRSSLNHGEHAYHRLSSGKPIALNRTWQETNETILKLRHGSYWATPAHLDARYPCHSLLDYDPIFFCHDNMSLRQPEIYDLNNALVPPWELPSVLRDGTLLMIEGSLKVYTPPSNHPYIQFIAQSITVLDNPVHFSRPLPRFADQVTLLTDEEEIEDSDSADSE
ncbi:hypothetical protein CVT24_001409 [Panaeolus cyanescens]|uniref:Uncharacterized protein n=1 Tax=Panaeolus cyanescens TaxID=181874 RepID=A0A409WIL9_9AGAR|nr:hypothetical protein CVT24_001409 [Panaeolus cyanescens]